MTTEQKAFFDDVLAELDRAEHKHQSWPDDAVHASAILNEEAGKLTQACIDYHNSHKPENEALQIMRKRAVSTAAMALRFAMGSYETAPEA